MLATLPARAFARPFTVSRFLVAALLVLAPLASLAQSPAAPAASGFQFTSKGTTEVNLATGVTTNRGGARLVYQGSELTADEISYNQRLGSAVARGNVRLITGTRILLADEMTYQVADGAFTATGLRLGDSPLYLTAAKVSGNREAYVLEDARIFYDRPGPFSPTLAASRLTYSGDREVRADGVRLGLGFFQPIFLPTFDRNLNAPFFSLLTATGGYRSTLGAFALTGLELPVGRQASVGGQLGFYTERGVMAGPSASYRFGDAGGGNIRTGYIHDNGDRLTDVLGRPVPADRGYVEWNHRQRLSDRWTLLGSVNYWSDSEIIRDFRRKDFTNIQTPDSFVEATYAGDNHVVSLLARAQPNPYHRMQQRLPEARIDLLPSELIGGIYQRGQASAAVLREDDPAGTVATRRSDRFDAYYGLSRSFSPREWLGLQAVAGGRVTHYARALGGRDDYTRELGELGVDAELRASGTYAYRNERWGIDGLRHLVTPKVSYRYQPNADRGRAYIPPIDRRAFTTYLEPLGLGDQRNIDDFNPADTLRLSLDNRLQTRDPNYGSRDLVAFNVAADLRFDRDPGERELGTVHSELRLTPIRWLDFDFYHRLNPHSGRTQEFNTGLTLRDGDVRSVTLATHYLEGQIQEYVVDVEQRVNEVFQGFMRLHYDSRRQRFIEQSYGIRQTIDNLWWIRYEMSFYDGPRRESSFSFNVEVELAVF